MKAHDTRPGGIGVEAAASRKVTTPGVTPRPPTQDDEGTVPRRILEIARKPGPVSEPLPSEPLLGAALTASLGSMGDTAPDAPFAGKKGGFGDTTPEPRREMPSASELLAACAPTPQAPQADAALEELAVAAKVTPMIPERADSDGARNARFATEGVPARAANVTMPTGEVLVDPSAQDPRVVVNLEALGESRPRRVALPTVPSGHVLEREEDQAYRWEQKRGLVAGISIAAALLAAALLAAIASGSKKVEPGAGANPVVATQVTTQPTAPHPVVTVATTPTAHVISPVPPGTEPVTTAAPKPHGSSHAGSGLKSPVTTAPPNVPNVPPVAPVVTTPPVATPAPASSVPDISHSIH